MNCDGLGFDLGLVFIRPGICFEGSQWMFFFFFRKRNRIKKKACGCTLFFEGAVRRLMLWLPKKSRPHWADMNGLVIFTVCFFLVQEKPPSPPGEGQVGLDT
ncbi:hypothetical protein [Mucilaginibacter sp.]